MTESSAGRAVTYRKRDTETLVHDVRTLLEDHGAVELWGAEMTHHATVNSRPDIWECERGNRGAVVNAGGGREFVRPEDVDELVPRD